MKFAAIQNSPINTLDIRHIDAVLVHHVTFIIFSQEAILLLEGGATQGSGSGLYS
jgi:hypothetical protein